MHRQFATDCLLVTTSRRRSWSARRPDLFSLSFFFPSSCCRRCCCGCCASDRLCVRVHRDAGEVVPDDLVNCEETEKGERRCWWLLMDTCDCCGFKGRDLMAEQYLMRFGLLWPSLNSDKVISGCSNLLVLQTKWSSRTDGEVRTFFRKKTLRKDVI